MLLLTHILIWRSENRHSLVEIWAPWPGAASRPDILAATFTKLCRELPIWASGCDSGITSALISCVEPRRGSIGKPGLTLPSRAKPNPASDLASAVAWCPAWQGLGKLKSPQPLLLHVPRRRCFDLIGRQLLTVASDSPSKGETSLPYLR